MIICIDLLVCLDYLIANSLIEISNIKNCLDNITVRRVNLEPLLVVINKKF